MGGRTDWSENMITKRSAIFTIVMAASFMSAPAGHVKAESYPSRPVRFIVPFPTGGSTDVAARTIAAYLSRALGQQVYVENRSGANGSIGTEAATKSPPDGYTILITSDSVLSNPYVFKTDIDAMRELMPVIQLTRQPIVLAVHPSLGVSTLAELIALAKKQPGLRYATGSGTGSPQSMVVQWFAHLAGIRMEQVAYRGGGQAVNDLIAGHVTIGSLGATPLIPHYKAGTLRLLAQTTEVRSPSLPEVPTYQEAGIKGLAVDQWVGAFVPLGTPAAIIERLNREIGEALSDPSVRQICLQQAQEPIGGTTEQFSRLIHKDSAMYERLAKDLNIKAD
jgi:tripartite-type tricarboxylate transporter receptor subunit TctC